MAPVGAVVKFLLKKNLKVTFAVRFVSIPSAIKQSACLTLQGYKKSFQFRDTEGETLCKTYNMRRRPKCILTFICW